MLERHERYAFSAIVGTLVVAVLIYCGAFVSGVIKGLLSL